MTAHHARIYFRPAPTGPGVADLPQMNKETAEAVVASLEEIIGTVDEQQAEVAGRPD